MELRELRAFIALAEELNFSRAAERLNMTQPPLTRLIRRLEHTLGVELFQRTTRKVVLTKAGNQLLKQVTPLIDQADAVARSIRHEVADRASSIVIGCTSLGFITVLPEALDQLRAAYPDTEVDVREVPTDALVSGLVSAEIDLALLLLPQSHDALEIKSLFRRRMKLAVSASHPLANVKAAPLADFANDKFIMHERDHAPTMYDEIVRCCAVAGFRPKMIEKPWNSTCTALVAASVGVHFVAGEEQCITPAGIVLLDIEDPAPILELGMAWRADDPAEVLEPFKLFAGAAHSPVAAE